VWTWLLTIAGGLAMLVGVVTAAHRWSVPFRHAWGRVSDFLDDWRGEPARDGRDAIPSFPARMKGLEETAKALQAAADDQRHYTHELSHFARSDLAGRLQLVQATLEQQKTDSARDVGELKAGLARLDGRVTSHRRRNDEQIRLLQEAVDELRARDRHGRATDPDQEQT